MRSSACAEFRKLSRRGVVQAGVLGVLGLGLSDLLRTEAAQAADGIGQPVSSSERPS